MASTGTRSTDNAENSTATRTIGLTLNDDCSSSSQRPEMCTKIYLRCVTDIDETETVSVTIETFIVLFVHNYLNRPNALQLYLVCDDNGHRTDGAAIRINVGDFRCIQMSRNDYANELTALCNFPVALTKDRIVIAGMCGVCRCLVKNDVQFTELLGFKGACLLSPSESSIWTKFCEVDIVECVKQVLMNSNEAGTECDAIDLPEALSNFEGHLSQPIRTHNVYKLARQLANEEYNAKQRIDEEALVNSFENFNVNGNGSAQTDSVNTGGQVPRIKKTKVSY